MTTIYENQSIAFTDLSGNNATISPAVGFTITTPTQTLTANVNGFTNGVQNLLFSDIYTTVNKTPSITYPPTNATTLNINNTISLSDGITTNTLDQSDWTGTIKTLLSTQNLTHYINMSDASGTGQGNPQKSSLITANPSTGIITASGFTGTATNTAAINLTSDNTSGTYFIPFAKTTNGNNILYVDNVTGPLSYNPSTSSLTSLLLNGRLIQPVTQNTATFAGTTLSINGGSSTFFNSNINFTGSGNNINTLTLTNMIVGGEYNIGLYNGGSGNLTINTGLGTNIKTIHSSNVSISSGSYGLMKINVLTINALTIYIVQVNQLS